MALRPRDPAGLRRFAVAASTPGSAAYRHFLTTAQFAARFGQRAVVIRRVTAALRAAGLPAGHVAANHLLLRIATTTGKAAAALHTRFARYRLASGRVAIANTSAPRLPGGAAQVAQAVIGLNTLTSAAARPLARPRLAAGGRPAAREPRPCAAAIARRKQEGAWTYDQLARAYNVGAVHVSDSIGSGGTVALFELQPFSTRDIAGFQACYGTSADVTSIDVDGGAPPGHAVEPTLDIDTVIGMAPQAHILVYSAPGTSYAQSTIDLYTRIVDDNRAQVLSTSYGVCEPVVVRQAPGLIPAENVVLQQAAAQGITVFDAAGDTGSEACQRLSPSLTQLSVQDPASQPFITTPVHGYVIFYNGQWTVFGGTSAAAPLWAALVNRIDAQTNPAGRAGFVNPALYSLHRGVLHHIVIGNNDYTGTHGGRYPATPRYDMASGLGTPDGGRLAAALR